MAGKGTVGQLLVEMRADLSGLRIDVKEMEKTFQSSFSNIQGQAASFARGLALSFVSAFSVREIFNFSKELLALGGQLKDLSQQTGISGQTLSGLKSTLEENGTSLDAFAKGIFTLQKNLGGIKNESDPAAEAVKALGLNLDQIRKADTDTFLQLVTDALGKIDNPLNRAQIGAALLGKNFRELGPAINEMAGRLAELRKGGLSPDDINRLDEFGDSLTRLNNKIKLLAAEGLATLIRDLSNINFLFSQMFNKSAAVGAILGGAAGVAEQSKVQVPFTPPVDTAAINKLKGEVDSFIAGLQKQADALRVNIVEMKNGDQASKSLGLDLEFAAFKAKLLADNLKVPPDAQTKFNQLKTTILELNQQLDDQKAKTDALKVSMELIDKSVTDNAKNMTTFAQILKQIGATGFGEVQQAVAAVNNTFDDLFLSLIKFQDELIETGKMTPEIADQISKSLATIRLERALGTVRARVGAEGEGVDAEAEAKARADKLGEDLANSLTSGMKNTLLGIETGQQTLGEGMKNLVRNMLLELQGAVFDKGVLEPLKAIAAGFISGLVGALDDAANDQLKDWAKGLGNSLKGWLGSGLSSLFGSFSFGDSGAAGPELLAGPGFATGGMIPSFAKGGLFIGHGGEFVMQKKAVDSIGAGTLAAANQSGRLPGGGMPAVNIEINGDITPRQPNMTPDQVVRVTAGNITNDGMIMSAIESRMRMKGR